MAAMTQTTPTPVAPEAGRPGGGPPIYRLIRPFQEFARLQASGGILLLVCTVCALLLANSPWSEAYGRLLNAYVTVGADGFSVRETVLHWVNDGLMAVFFFLVGLEIKREVLTGELSSPRQAALPIAAALGGMAAPALLYLAVNRGGPGAAGWGVPMATDIAFALGALALLGDRAPAPLKVFLAAFAIADDIGAVLVIALFYTASVHLAALGVGFAVIALSALANKAGVRSPLVYALLGVVSWVAFLESGIHATVAGVLLAMTVPASARIDPDAFAAQARGALGRFESGDTPADGSGLGEERQAALHTLEKAAERVQTPLHRMEHALHPWVSFLIMPVFALANAGVALGGAGASLVGPVPLGIALGLVIGKPLGVTLLAWIAVRAGVAVLPAGLNWRHLLGAGWLGGIGFTMALFIAGLAFPDPASLAAAKVGILAASAVAGVVGFLILRGAAPAGGGVTFGLARGKADRVRAAVRTPRENGGGSPAMAHNGLKGHLHDHLQKDNRHDNHPVESRHTPTHRKTNMGEWECPHCHRKVHEPNGLPPETDLAAWQGICAQHDQGCDWCRQYAPPAIWKKQPAAA
jgi:NhaA family Na+:H+ antiporter